MIKETFGYKIDILTGRGIPLEIGKDLRDLGIQFVPLAIGIQSGQVLVGIALVITVLEAIETETPYKGAEKLLRENMDKLVLIAETLMQKETLDGRQLQELMSQGYLTEDGQALQAAEQPVGELG